MNCVYSYFFCWKSSAWCFNDKINLKNRETHLMQMKHWKWESYACILSIKIQESLNLIIKTFNMTKIHRWKVCRLEHVLEKNSDNWQFCILNYSLIWLMHHVHQQSDMKLRYTTSFESELYMIKEWQHMNIMWAYAKYQLIEMTTQWLANILNSLTFCIQIDAYYSSVFLSESDLSFSRF